MIDLIVTLLATCAILALIAGTFFAFWFLIWAKLARLL